MMIKVIQDGTKKIAFFSNSLRSFEINNDTERLINLLNCKTIDKKICSTLSISLDELTEIKTLFSKYDEEPITDERRIIPDNVLKRLSINISNECNMTCTYCYAGFGCYGLTSNLMSIEHIKITLDKFYDMYDEIAIIQVFGGEPFLNFEGFKFICEYVERKFKLKMINYRTQINTVTNGTLINKKIIELIKQYDINVTISLDGPKLVHDENRTFKNKKGTHELILKNIKKLNAVTDQPTQIEITYNQKHIVNGYSIPKLIEYFDNLLSNASLHIAPVSATDSKCYALKDRNEFINSVESLILNGRKKNYMILDDILESFKYPMVRNHFCDAGIDLISVSSLGDIYPCYMFIDELNFKIFNINDTFSKKDILDKLKFYRKNNRSENNSCKSCFAKNTCTGCIGINYYNTGDIYKPVNDDCKMKQAMLKKMVLNIENL